MTQDKAAYPQTGESVAWCKNCQRGIFYDNDRRDWFHCTTGIAACSPFVRTFAEPDR